MTRAGARIGRNRASSRPATRAVRAAAIVMLVMAVAGCQSVKDVGTAIFPSGPGLEAAMRGTGSAATGTVRVHNFRDGVSVQLSIFNMPPGNYRVALHENGNCSSPNLYSAGPAWAPAGSGKTPQDLLPQFSVNTEQDMPSYVAYISGARTDGPLSLRGKSVVIHLGTRIDDAIVGQRNNRIACGVLDEIRSPF